MLAMTCQVMPPEWRMQMLTLDHLACQPALQAQHRLLLRLLPVLQGWPGPLGAAVVGSLATAQADRLSDVDVVVYCAAGQAAPLLAALVAAALTASVVLRWSGRHDDASVFEKVVDEDWLSWEIHAIEPSTRMRLRAPCVVLHDTGGVLDGRRDDRKPIGPASVRVVDGDGDGLAWELFNCIKWLRRGDVARAQTHLQDLVRVLPPRTS